MATQSRNPLFDWDVSKFADIQNLSEQFAVPGVDSSVLLESQRKNIETLTAANRAVYEGAQALAQRQAEILRETMSEAVKATRELSAATTPQDQFAKQAQLMKHGYETVVTNMRELTELNTKSGATVMDLISKRVSEGLDEIQKAVHVATPGFGSTGASRGSEVGHTRAPTAATPKKPKIRAARPVGDDSPD